MARRATTTQEPRAVKAEKVKQEKMKVKEEKVNKGKGKARHVEEDEDEEEDEPEQEQEEEPQATQEYDEQDEYEQEDESGSPRGSKRRRTNGQGDSAPSGSQTQSQSQDQPMQLYKTLPRGDDGYIPGSIVRIQLYNFVTYDYVEFRPGPYLNMIVGPNGTGKSSIACAIALGLNFPASILGRATDLNSYVKNGEAEGYIEIELKGPQGRKNLVIKRSLKSDSKTSSFTLNGVAATGQEIKNKVAQLNVQVGNLCSFLPQDRVSEFAAMSPQQLLRETQRAAGDENLTQWHDTLISAGKDLRSIQQTIKDEELSLNQMKERNEGIERDVQRFLERKKIEHDIALLKVLVPVAQYRETREKFVQVKAKQRQLHSKVQRLKEKNAPAHEKLRHLDQDHKNADADRDALKKASQSKFKRLADKARASDRLEAEMSRAMDELINLRDSEKQRQTQIKSLQKEIQRLEEEIAKPPPEGLATEEEVMEEGRQIRLERSGLESRKSELEGQIKASIFRKAEAEQTLKAAQAELNKEQNADTQKLNKLQRWDMATYLGVKWVRDNRHQFKMEVFETPFMRLSMKNPQFASAVESCFGGNQLKAFVAQCEEDADTLNRYLNDERVLGKEYSVTVWYRAYNEMNILPPPMTREEMQSLGFDGYALDYLEFPEGMRWFLSHHVNLHRTAISLRGVDITNATEMVGRPIGNFSGGASFISRDTMNIVTRSKYGKRALTNMTRDIQPARNLTLPSIDPETKARIDQAMQEAQQHIAMYDEEVLPIRRQLKKIAEEDQVYTERHAAMQKKKDAIRDESRRVQSAKSKCQSKKNAFQTEMRKPPVEQERKKLKKKLMANTQQRLILAKEYTTLVHAIIDEQERCTKVGLNYLQIAANMAALQELCERKDQRYNAALEAFTKVNDQFGKIKTESKEILQRSRDTVKAAPEDVKEEYAELEAVRMQWEKDSKEAKEHGLPAPDDSAIDKRSVGELQAELETQQANLEMNLNTNPGVVEQYEKRKRDIELLEKTLEDRKRKEVKVERDIKNARDNWQPALQSLVNSIGEKFSAAFDRIGCAGEIRIREDEDFEKWAIDILVKFRDSEKLQLLTAHRQSGGERSLTTILYLMSLTEEARAPFSLVDEINQGMDQRAERVVHNSMVNVTCQADSAQYFLITPKLLPDLEYHERMKVLCVNNGEWLPEVKGIGKMWDMIDVYESMVKGKRGGRGDI